jgi:hypothetical protein
MLFKKCLILAVSRIICKETGPKINIYRKFLFREQGTGSREQETGNREQGTGSREQGTGSREQGAGNREQGAGSREQGTGNGARLWSFFMFLLCALRR